MFAEPAVCIKMSVFELIILVCSILVLQEQIVFLPLALLQDKICQELTMVALYFRIMLPTATSFLVGG